MRQVATRGMIVLTATTALCAACGSTGSLGTDEPATDAAATSQLGSPSVQYGGHDAVQATISTVKLQGREARLSSRAVRLPERPLGAIAVYGYQFPPSCGAHEFRVLEAGDTLILEYRFATRDGETQAIRDYVRGPSPFVGPGLWTAYDHMEDGIPTMRSQVEQRGGRLLKGAYSRGLVTGLADAEQRTFGSAYQRALGDAFACAEAQTLVSTTGE